MSSNNSAGIVVHIPEELQHAQMIMLEASSGSDESVNTVRINRDRKHLMQADYMPGVFASRQIINCAETRAAMLRWQAGYKRYSIE